MSLGLPPTPRALTPWRRGVLFLSLAVGLLGLPVAAGLRWLPEGSQPTGFYWRSSLGEAERGILVEACVPGLVDVLGRGVCPDRTRPVVKRVAAVAGDVVEVRASGVWVDGLRLPGSSRPDVRPPRPFLDGTYVLSPGEVWLHAGHHPRSVDSRLFGPVPVRWLRAEWRRWP
ncbi:MAG: S26 family signal peptidase [Acidobacteriota bacterium]